jgi:trimeric autotransporter adhesin
MRRCIQFVAFLLPALLLTLSALAQQDVITTAIGGGPSEMPAIDADLNNPAGVPVDTSGNYYVSAYNQNRVFKVDSKGVLTVFAGDGVPGYGGDGIVGGAAQAFLNGPSSAAVDGAGNVYIADQNNCVIRKVDTHNTITTIAGIAGQCSFDGDGKPATSFELNHPSDVALDASGSNLYVADHSNCRIRKLVLASDTISTYAGTGACGFSGDGGPASSAQLNQPYGVATDGAGNVYIADTINYRIREVTKSDGNINTIAGNGTNGFTGDGGPATIAEISNVGGLIANGAGTIVTFADNGNSRVRQFTVGGNIATIAGSVTRGFCGDNGPATSACLNFPNRIAAIGSGSTSFYVADSSNNRIRQFTVGDDINTVAGNGSTTMPTLLSGIAPDGVVLNNPYGVFADPSNNVFVADTTNCIVRELVHANDLVDFFAGLVVNAVPQCGFGGDGGPATQAKLNKPNGVARDKAGNIYIADTNNCRVRQVNTAGNISTFAGTGVCGYSGDGGAASSAQLNVPVGIFVDKKGNLYIADQNNNVIREVINGTISTIAGTGTGGYLGDGDPATSAELNHPDGVTVDSSGNVFIADTYNHRIREVTAATGIISTVAGTGIAGFNGDGLAIQRDLNYPQGIVVDANDNLFIADTNNHRLRWVDPDGTMVTFGGTGSGDYNGDGGLAVFADLFYPSGISQDPAGNFLVADQSNWRIRGIAAFAALNSSASNLDFGLVNVGSTSNPQTVTLGGVGPLTIYNILTTGDFSESDDCGSGIPNGGTCTVYVYFTPTTSGTRQGTITINDNGFFNGVTIISLEGTGSAISITGAPVAFGNQAVKTTSNPKNVTVTNNGTKGITMGAITLNETTDFAISSNTCPAPGKILAGKANCTISLTFTPQTTGGKKGALIINDSDPSSPQVVGLSGTGTSNVAFSPNSINFTAQAVGTTSAGTKVTLTNNTGKVLTLGTPAVTLSGPFLNTKNTSCTNGLVVQPKGTCVIAVAFKPAKVGYAVGTLSVSDNDPTSPQIVPLTGVGTGVEFTPALLNFGTSSVGHQVLSSMTITNVGTTTITFTAAQIVGPNRKDFGSAAGNPPCRGSIDPGNACTFNMSFDPSKTGKESATYLVYDNSPGSPQALSLVGTGQ